MNRMLYTYGAIVLAAAVALAGYELIDWCGLDATEWAAWVGAIGTIAAFAGTIWIATSDRRRRERDARLQAYLVAAGMRLRIELVVGVVSGITRRLGAMALVDQAPDTFNRISEKLLELDTWSQESLLPLVGIPNHLAINLAQAADEINTIGESIKMSASHSDIEISGKRRSLAAQMHNMLRQTVKKLEEALVECERSVELLKGAEKN